MAKVLKRTVWGGDFWFLYKRPFQITGAAFCMLITTLITQWWW